MGAMSKPTDLCLICSYALSMYWVNECVLLMVTKVIHICISPSWIYIKLQISIMLGDSITCICITIFIGDVSLKIIDFIIYVYLS